MQIIHNRLQSTKFEDLLFDKFWSTVKTLIFDILLAVEKVDASVEKRRISMEMSYIDQNGVSRFKMSYLWKVFFSTH